MNEISMPAAVEGFVAATNAHDAEALFGVFASDAIIVDDGTTYATEAAIREWIRVHQIEPKIVISPVSFDLHRLVASVDGDFPGGPLVFAFDFTIELDAITKLSIELA